MYVEYGVVVCLVGEMLVVFGIEVCMLKGFDWEGKYIYEFEYFFWCCF